MVSNRNVYFIFYKVVKIGKRTQVDIYTGSVSFLDTFELAWDSSLTLLGMDGFIMKLLSCCCVSLFALFSGMTYAAGETWTGKLYNITPTHMNVTEQYCKEHVLDTYQTTPEMISKEVTAQNGVKAKDLGFTSREEGGVYFHTGTAEFSGTYDGKPWKETVHYFSQSLMPKGDMQGAWYTKDCKGFYKVGSSS
jgi:hypothetical protein